MERHRPRRTLADVAPELASVLGEIKEALRDLVGDEFRLVLFGSRARGDSEPDSDVDLMVILPDALYGVETEHRIWDRVSDFSSRDDLIFNVLVTSESLAREYSGFKAYGAAEREGVPV
jgi:predicted nucleotidyltransferase